MEKFDTVSAALKNRLAALSDAGSAIPQPAATIGPTIAEAQAAYNNYYRGFRKLARQVKAQAGITPQAANQLMKPFREQIYTSENSVDALVSAGADHLVDVEATAARLGSRTQGIILTCFIGGFLLIGTLGLLTIRRIRAGLTTIIQQLAEISKGEGNLTRHLKADSRDEIGQLSSLFNGFLDTLQEMIRRIGGNARELASSTVAVSCISSQLSQAVVLSSKKNASVAVSAEAVNANFNGIASAMEQAANNVGEASQGIQEINANVSQSSAAVDDIAHEIDALSHSAKESAEGIAGIDTRTSDLHNLSKDLQSLVGRFKV